jgi:hypothetical protein
MRFANFAAFAALVCTAQLAVSAAAPKEASLGGRSLGTVHVVFDPKAPLSREIGEEVVRLLTESNQLDVVTEPVRFRDWTVRLLSYDLAESSGPGAAIAASYAMLDHLPLLDIDIHGLQSTGSLSSAQNVGYVIEQGISVEADRNVAKLARGIARTIEARAEVCRTDSELAATRKRFTELDRTLHPSNDTTEEEQDR